MSYCATCDAALYRDKRVAVIGGGDSAVEEGMFLTKFADEVYVVHRRDELRGGADRPGARLRQPQACDFVWDTVVNRIDGDTKVEGVDTENVKTARPAPCRSTASSSTSGRSPTRPRQGPGRLDEGGYIVTDERLMTSRAGVFACGDARANPLKQIANAVGEGALAAIEAEKYLDALPCPTAATTTHCAEEVAKDPYAHAEGRQQARLGDE